MSPFAIVALVGSGYIAAALVALKVLICRDEDTQPEIGSDEDDDDTMALIAALDAHTNDPNECGCGECREIVARIRTYLAAEYLYSLPEATEPAR